MTGFQHGQHVFGGGIDFIFVEVCDLLQHGVHSAGGFADADHLDQPYWERRRIRGADRRWYGPSSIALRTFISASSSTALPEVRAVMAKPSRIGTRR